MVSTAPEHFSRDLMAATLRMKTIIKVLIILVQAYLPPQKVFDRNESLE